MQRVHADLLLVACAVIWGLSFLFQKSAMEHVGPLTFVAARGLLAAAALAPFAWIEHRRTARLVSPRLAVLTAAAGIAFFAAAFLQQSGIKTTSMMNTGFLTALYVILTPFVSALLTKRTVTPVVWYAVGLSCVGTWMLGGGTLAAFGTGDALVAASAIFWALHVVLLALTAPLGRPVLVTCLQFLLAGLIAGAAALPLETISVEALRAATSDILYVGLLSGALTFTVLTAALRATSPTEAAIIMSSDTVFAALAAWLILGERLSPLGMTGGAALIAAVLVVQLSPMRR